ncbi:MAG: 50S ribosomal protein L10 [Candidatus Micrarchaeota archaeon]|nr:50S ribosomal protein L10 [Candidatus Micrarchaeota archaeon]
MKKIDTKNNNKKANEKKPEKKDKIRPELQRKMRRVNEITELLKKHKTACLVSAVRTPNRIIQKLKKTLKGDALFIMDKQIVLKKALENANLSKLVDKLTEPSYLVLSNLSVSELYEKISSTRENVYAVEGNTAPDDILVEKGTTELQPGPVLTELKNAGLEVMIDKGKIAIKNDKIVAKKGEKISKAVANVLRLLNIKPIQIYATMKYAISNNLVYSSQLLEEYSLNKLGNLVVEEYKKAVNLSVNANYYTQENIKLLLARAYHNSNALAITQNLITTQSLDYLLLLSQKKADAINNNVKLS